MHLSVISILFYITLVHSNVQLSHEIISESRLSGSESKLIKRASGLASAVCVDEYNYGVNVCAVRDQQFNSTKYEIKIEEVGKAYNTLIISDSHADFLPLNVAVTFPSLERFLTKRSTFEKVERENLANLRNLIELHLVNGELKEISSDSFDDLMQLKILMLNGNRIEYLNSQTFKNLINLKKFSAEDNKIEFIHSKLFENLQNLESFSIAGNKLMTIPSTTFKKMKKIQEIDLSRNKIKHLDENTFDGLNSLRILNLRENFENCFLPNYGNVFAEDSIDGSEIRRDIRDGCTASDFEIYRIHALSLHVYKKYIDAN